ncbi:MAG: cellulase family glycosylhydrolase [Clostridia bacterium]|nr:cellulase family glycosylhydrolase [Clostridia bacterium]
MKKTVSRDRVNGFLDVSGRRIVNGIGEEVLLTGWGLGNWLLCEGYMWQAFNLPRFDRPRRIEAVVEELTGKAYAEKFWKRFRASYITESDIQMMADMGCNSVRVPINARLFLREGPGVVFEDEGFECLDRVLAWCEQYRLYAFIDLHGAPGGQTGANIDDSVDDMCRLFMDEDQFEKGLCLWERIAERYHDRWIVGGYDLLNEPIRPARFEGDTDLDRYLPRLKEFYEKCIARIRAVDKKHLITLEGHHWATATDIFDHVYDPKMVIHFHRYGCDPDISAFRPWLDLSEKLNAPLWLGETGENTMEWFSAMMPLAASLDIGVNMWPWKKMNCGNSPCSVVPPAGWQLILDYARGGAHPGYDRARAILNEYLKNMLVENCAINEKLAANVFRLPGCTVAGTDFDELPGPGRSYGHIGDDPPVCAYRHDTGMTLFCRYPDREKRFAFDGDWSRYVLRLREGEFACYSLYDVTVLSRLEVVCYAGEVSVMEVYQDDALLGRFDLSAAEHKQILSGMHLNNADGCRIRLKTVRGCVDIETLITDTDT